MEGFKKYVKKTVNKVANIASVNIPTYNKAVDHSKNARVELMKSIGDIDLKLDQNNKTKASLKIGNSVLRFYRTKGGGIRYFKSGLTKKAVNVDFKDESDFYSKIGPILNSSFGAKRPNLLTQMKQVYKFLELKGLDNSKIKKKEVKAISKKTSVKTLKKSVDTGNKNLVKGGSPNLRIRKLKKEQDIYKKNILIHADKPVINAEKYSRRKYVEHIFKSTQQNVLPKGIQKKLANIIQGLPSIESRGYNNSLTSSAKAYGIWQIKPVVFKEQGIEKKKWNKMTVQTKVAFKKMQQIYKSIFKTGIYGKYGRKRISLPAIKKEAFKKQFKLSEKQWENFVVMIIVNSYNAGEARMLRCINNFSKKYSSKKVLLNTKNKTELGLFELMTLDAQKNISGYGKEAQNYVFKVLAASQSLTNQSLDFSKIKSKKKGKKGGFISKLFK